MLSSVSNFMVGLFGSRNQRLLKRYGVLVAAANALEPGLSALADDALRAKTVELKERYAAAPDLEALLPEAFAAEPGPPEGPERADPILDGRCLVSFPGSSIRTTVS